MKLAESGIYALEIGSDLRRLRPSCRGKAFDGCDQFIQSSLGLALDLRERGVDALGPLRRQSRKVLLNHVGHFAGEVAFDEPFHQKHRDDRRKRLPVAIEDLADVHIRLLGFGERDPDFGGMQADAVSALRFSAS